MRVLKKFEDLIQVLLEDGYRPDPNGNWAGINSSDPIFDYDTFAECGMEVDLSDWRELKASWLDITIDYPCIMKSKITGVLVYFIDESHGIVIEDCASEDKVAGEVGHDWDMGLFELWAEVAKVAE